jgi:hypothetical protein
MSVIENRMHVALDEFQMPPGYPKMLRRYFELTLDEDWVMTSDGNNERFFSEYGEWKEYMRHIHRGPFLSPDEYNVIRDIMNTYVATWMEAGWVERYSLDMYTNHDLPHRRREHERMVWDLLENEVVPPPLLPLILNDGVIRADDDDDDIYMDVEVPNLHGQNVFENEHEFPEYMDTDDEYMDNDDTDDDDDTDTDDDLPALYNTITGEYFETRSPPRPIPPTNEYVLLSHPDEMMEDVCCICLESHTRCCAVTLKNCDGNVCHEIGMTCFLQWSECNRNRRTAVQCPLCKSNVSAIVYQYCI